MMDGEERFRKLVEQAPIAMAIVGMDGAIEFINRRAVSCFGYSHEDIPTMERWYAQAYPDEAYRAEVVADWTDRVMKAVAGGDEIPGGAEIPGGEYRVTRKDGEIITAFISGAIVSDKVFVLFDDITARKLAEECLEKQLAEKDILIKEVHHRIKNNIASIEALLSIQLGSTDNPEVASVLRDVIGRIAGMKLLYDKLILIGGSGMVSVKGYAEGLVAAIADLFPLKEKVAIETEVDDFALDSKQLFYLGIIINEIITNAYKYAFLDRDSGTLRVSLKRIGGRVLLDIRDDGPGFPSGLDSGGSKGFGLMLVGMLAEQLGGGLSRENSGGSRTTLEFGA
jgi:PAS domain S-box-containing protein